MLAAVWRVSSSQGRAAGSLAYLCFVFLSWLASLSASLPLPLSLSPAFPPLSPFPMPLPRKNANHFLLNLLCTTQGYIYLNPGSDAHVKIKISEISFLQTEERGH